MADNEKKEVNESQEEKLEPVNLNEVVIPQTIAEAEKQN